MLSCWSSCCGISFRRCSSCCSEVVLKSCTWSRWKRRSSYVGPLARWSPELSGFDWNATLMSHRWPVVASSPQTTVAAETGSGLPGHSCTLHTVRDSAPVQALMSCMHVAFTWTLDRQFFFLTAFIRSSVSVSWFGFFVFLIRFLWSKPSSESKWHY